MPMSGGRIWANSAAAGLLLLAALLIFPRLDGRYLWDDEAETALLAQRVLRFGVPIAWDGRDLVSQECSTDFDANYLWRQTPWAQFYLAALSFKLLGADTLTARLPFALLGLLAIVSLYRLGVSLFGDRHLALLASSLLTLSVPFLLHVRQARYYALAILATVWVLYFFFALLRDGRGAILGLALAMTVLFHSNYLVFFATAAGLALAFFAFPFDARAALRLLGTGVATLAINISWLAIFDVWGKAGLTVAVTSVRIYALVLKGYVAWVELYACSVVLLVALAAVRVGLVGRRASRDWPAPRTCLALGLFAVGHVLLLSAAPYAFFRYVVTLLPALALLQAAVLRALWSANRVTAVVGYALLVFLDRSDLVHGALGSTPAKYVDEITHDVPGPTAAIVSYLRAHARPGERVFITYGDLPLRFYTPDLEVRGGHSCQSLAGWPRPDWIVRRYFFRFRMRAADSAADLERARSYLQAEISTRRYAEIHLPTVDTIWENIPEPDHHFYRQPAGGPLIIVYHKIE
jgi:dolichyl-phosphate-mannose-protein mannosyltransferase